MLSARGWEVSTVNLAGHGGRSIGSVRSVAGLASDVVGRRPGSWTMVVGHSLGAVVALELVALFPSYARGVLLEDPPALGGVRASGDIADDIGREVLRAHVDPHGAMDAMLAGHPTWNRRDARSMLEGRLQTDPQIATLSPGDISWDLPALVASSPVPVALLAAAGPESALFDPDRAALLRSLPPARVTELAATHHVHLDQPERWVEAVDTFGTSLIRHS
ncbi:MAG: alpha/beta fold hydrolase [Marmoricola sp.]|nr:alpha/beta fold hydrolase [Marmoricola sp.]